jgi:hypothetical protein
MHDKISLQSDKMIVVAQPKTSIVPANADSVWKNLIEKRHSCLNFSNIMTAALQTNFAMWVYKYRFQICCGALESQLKHKASNALPRTLQAA